ncbi:MAG: PilW family protein [Rhodocyclaceae bacterium]|nr:PilW family protein [Rhodocyclaceae bacterium]
MINRIDASFSTVTRPDLRPQRGFSLVELMVAVAIGLLIVVAMLALFVNMSRSNRELSKANIQIENGRFAIQLIKEDVVHAGFWGAHVPDFDDVTFETTPTQPPIAIPDPCLAFNAANWTPAHKNNLLGISVQSNDSVPGTCGPLIVDRKANTDILVVRHAETCVAGQPLTNDTSTNCPNTAGEIYIQSSLCSTEPKNAYVLDTGGHTLTAMNCTTPAPRRKFISNIYYIRNYAAIVGDGIPTLMRASFGATGHQVAVPLIEGIEDFRIELGIDDKSKTGANANFTLPIEWLYPDPDRRDKLTPTNRGDGIPDRTMRCTAATPCTAEDLANAVLVKVYVLARNLGFTPGHVDSKTYSLGGSAVGPFGDQYQRHVFSSAIRITNVSARREMP